MSENWTNDLGLGMYIFLDSTFLGVSRTLELGYNDK